MSQVTDIAARTAKISMPIADADFPIAAIPPKGTPGSAKARLSLRLRVLGRAGASCSRGVLAEAGIIYQQPTIKLTAAIPASEVGL